MRTLVRKRLCTAASLLAGLLVLATLLVSQARAEFTKATLLSGTSQFQFSEANSPALATSGKYVAFQGTLAGVPGVYRRDLQTGEVQLVAGGDAAAPSISADGNSIAFVTEEDLSPWQEIGSTGRHEGEPPQDVGCPEVYVRHMERTPQEPGAYVLAAAASGTNEGITFDTTGTGQVACSAGRGFTVAGTQAAPAVALSANGSEVAFTVLSESNLAGEKTSPGQVAVRDIESETTTLVTEEAANGIPQDSAVVGGGAYPDLHALQDTTVPFHSVSLAQTSYSYGEEPTASTAAISADGSTVAWLGTNVSAQVSAAEAARAPSLSGAHGESEAEPLWRRIADPSPITRRLLAGSELDFFTQNPVEPPNAIEVGSLLGTQGVDYVPPALSADGSTVAVLATAPGPAAASSLVGRITGLSELDSDAFVIDISDDPASAPRVTPLTEITTYDAQLAELSDIRDVAISADGRRVAFDTSRTPLESPTLSVISPASTQFVANTYEANLELGTLQRVSSAYDEAEPNGGAELLSLSEDGSTLVFASDATNLFFGDGVNASEVYEVHEVPQSAQVVPPQIGETPLLALPAPTWQLDVTATAAHDGSVVLDVQVPAAGGIGVVASVQMPAGSATATKARKARNARKSAKRPTALPGRLVTRTVAHAAAASTMASEVSVRVRVAAAYDALVASRDGLYALLRVTFADPGHGTLVEELPVTFHKVAVSSKKQKKKKTKGKKSDRGEHRKPGAKE